MVVADAAIVVSIVVAIVAGVAVVQGRAVEFRLVQRR